jgi:phenylacetaldehyde dehydrogenase
VNIATKQIGKHSNVQSFLDRTHGHYIGGAWINDTQADTVVISCPATGLPLSKIESGGATEIDAAVQAARASFNSGVWAHMVPVDRARILFSLADLIEQHAEQISYLEALDIGVSRGLMRDIGVKLAADQLRYYAGWVTKINGETITNSRPRAPGHDFLTYTLKEPVGVVGQIIPWNFPFGMALQKLSPALAAGCSIVLKPAEDAPLSTSYLAELISQTDIPAGVFNLVNGVGRKAGAALASHTDVDKISFTGSTSVGKEILHASTGNLKRIGLELGGKSPVVLMADANLQEAIPAAARAIFFLSGQNCMAGSRLLVHESIHDEVVAGLVELARNMRIGADLDNSYDIGPLISERQLTRVLAYIDTGLGEGATLVTGGKRVKGMAGYFVEPTIFTDCDAHMRIVKEEIFGPVLTVQKFNTNDLDEIADMANHTIFGLSASIWTQDLSMGHLLAAKIKSGQVGINVHAAIDPATPFGGYKQSGWGREFGRDGLEPYLETKAITAYL